MTHKKFYVGFVRGRLVLEEKLTNAGRKSEWRCQCSCGNECVIKEFRFLRGTPKSCGCLERENNTPKPFRVERKAYHAAKQRCSRRSREYHNYMGRGIQFKFTSVEQWLKELGPKPSPKHSVDRINNDGHYEPGNVRWADQTQQNINRHNKKLTAKDVIFIRKAKAAGIKQDVLAKWFDISFSYIFDLCNGASWWYV